ncbi:c-type cytochrome [Phenylobacterium immobile]|uniref:c-type cytochrome n=1 Tax=Phenylobacterium immobile TaxID=21 RepID=UPI000B1EF13A|nr:cytochrome c [Phenylobacterium immobile]
MIKAILKIGAACAAFAVASPVLADEPGPGGTKPLAPRSGEETYRMVCQSCHMPDGKGAAGAGAAYPALAGNPRLAAAPYPIMLVLNGKGAMPWFSDSLSHAQVADVVTYIRTHFGNAFAAPVTPEQVSGMARPAPVATH